MDSTPAPFPSRLSEGYRSFLDDRFVRERSRYEEQAGGQTPKIMLIGCCDSRVSPEVIFDARPGEMFVARNIANLIPPFQPDDQLHGTSAALEYAVQALKVEHIVVLGHGSCGGIRAFADDSQSALSPGDFIGKWITLIEPAARRTGGRGRNESFEDYLYRLELASIQQSVANLRTFPCVQILEQKGWLHLHGAFFAVATGVLMILDPLTSQFVPAVGEMPKRVQMIRCSEAGDS